MYKYVLILLIIGTGSFVQADVLNFKSWKQKKIIEAKYFVTSVRHELRKEQRARDNSDESRIEVLGKKLTQAEANLGVAEELSGTDYLLLYIFPNFKSDSNALRLASRSLGTEEMADIIKSYQEKITEQSTIVNNRSREPIVSDRFRD